MLARIAAKQQRYDLALAHIDKSLIRNYHSHTARHVKAALLRKLSRPEEALQLIEGSIAIDPFNTGCYFERSLINKQLGNLPEATKALHQVQRLMRNDRNNYFGIITGLCACRILCRGYRSAVLVHQ